MDLPASCEEAMSKYRVFLKHLEDERVILPEEEIHHLVRVRRCREGTHFEAIDSGSGKVYLCRLQKGGQGWHGELLQEIDYPAEPSLKVTLAQALIKKDHFEWVLQKAVELGVASIVPLLTERTEIRLDQRREEKKLIRWNRILAEAVKQCGRTHQPVLSEPVELDRFLQEVTGEPLLVLDEAGEVSFKTFLQDQRNLKSCSIVVGPEGGWSDRDRSEFIDRGLPRLRLGHRILRAETAPLAALAILQYEYGDLAL